MDRRQFMEVTSAGLGATLGCGVFGEAQTTAKASSISKPGEDTFQLTSKYSDASSQAMFTSAPQAGSVPPLMYLYFDRKTNRFVNPLEVTADKPQGKYELNVDLLSFNMSE